MLELHSDGGLLSSNPSEIGLTWAWVLVNDGMEIDRCSGSHMPAEFRMRKVSSNLAELIAAVYGLEAVGKRKAIWFTDSEVTVERMKRGHEVWINTPEDFVRRAIAVRESFLSVILLAGHPSRADLARGVNKEGVPVSKWNKVCDDLCKYERKLFEHRFGRASVSA